jgi:hypothetical protein
MSAFRLGNALEASSLMRPMSWMSTTAWTSVSQQKNAPGPLTTKTLVFASYSTTAQAWLLRNVLTV